MTKIIVIYNRSKKVVSYAKTIDKAIFKLVNELSLQDTSLNNIALEMIVYQRINKGIYRIDLIDTSNDTKALYNERLKDLRANQIKQLL